MIETRVATQSALNQFHSMTRGGQATTSAFYAPVTTDLSQLTQQDLEALDYISRRFKLMTVAKESVVQEFVEARTKRMYVVGQAYYQLMKPEKVQPHKAVLLVKKGVKAVWGGQKARELIGLPKGTPAKVTPGNHADYDIFVQSTSRNRKLPRGTKLLVDLQPWTAP